MKTKSLFRLLPVRLTALITGFFLYGCAGGYTEILTLSEAEQDPGDVSSVFLKDSTEIRLEGSAEFDFRPIGITGTTTHGNDTLIAWEEIAELQVKVPDTVTFSPDKIHLYKEIHLKNHMAVRPDNNGFFFDPLSGYINGKTENGLLIKLRRDNITAWFTELPETVTKEQMYADTTIRIQRLMLHPDNLLVSFYDQMAGISLRVKLLTGINSKNKQKVMLETKDIQYYSADRVNIGGVIKDVATVTLVTGAVVGVIMLIKFFNRPSSTNWSGGKKIM
ncbi:MAG: hypothetical protein FMNOHCHN_01944 [Ignavibacteriaceae bacterium]|nr:hypothetical protein [Ignavibacteriaceae bacterium]